MVLKKQTQPVIRPATKADIVKFRGKPYRESFRGIVVEIDGEIIGVAGVLHTEVLQAFSTIKDELRKRPKLLVTSAKIFRDVLRSYSCPVYAQASDKEKNAAGFLEYIGFEHYQGSVYKWPIQ